MQVVLRVLDAHQGVRLQAAGADETVMVFRQVYAEGDSVEVEVDTPGRYWVIALDNGLPPALVFMAGTTFVLPIPFGPERKAYSPTAFAGDMHRLSVRRAQPDEVCAPRNLALNPYDHHANAGLFPHCAATAQTRGEAAFAPRNAIDGETAAAGHGHWPYTSWGINRDPSAALTLTFGRPVRADRVALYLRADFPHDAWWHQASLTFSDGHTATVELVKTGGRQVFEIGTRDIEWVRVHTLQKADDPSAFPALTQLEVWGFDPVV